jgi:hypothetical protein
MLRLLMIRLMRMPLESEMDWHRRPGLTAAGWVTCYACVRCQSKKRRKHKARLGEKETHIIGCQGR